MKRSALVSPPPRVSRPARRRGRGRGVALACLAALSLLVTPLLPPSLRAIELRGMTYFQTPPWRLTFRNYYSTVMANGAEYYFTIEMPEQAGVGLGRVEIQQSTGSDWTFPFDVGQTRAFLGVPRRERAVVPVEARFDETRREFSIAFPEPPSPGQTVTVVLRPFNNPAQSGIYLFAVRAFPAGPNAVGQPVGFARIPIYNSDLF